MMNMKMLKMKGDKFSKNYNKCRKCNVKTSVSTTITTTTDDT